MTAVPAARASVVLLLALALALGQSFATIGSIRRKVFDAIAEDDDAIGGSSKVGSGEARERSDRARRTERAPQRERVRL